jgi:hypothetical protein
LPKTHPTGSLSAAGFVDGRVKKGICLFVETKKEPFMSIVIALVRFEGNGNGL